MAKDDYSGITLPPIAEDVEFDNSTNGFTSEEVQSAIEEAKDLAEGFPRAGLALVQNGTMGNNDLVSYSNLTPNTPIIFPVETKLNEVTFSNSNDSIEADLEFWRGGIGGTLITTLNVNTGTGVEIQVFDLNSLNITFTPGEILQIRYKDQGTNATDMVLVLWISRVS